MGSDIVSKRVLIRGDHPWAGEAGVVQDVEKTSAGTALKINLDSGLACMVFKREHIRVISNKERG